MKKRFSDEQIIGILREAEAGVDARELLYSSMYSFLTALLRNYLIRYKMKNPRKCVDLMGFRESHEIH
ncbi:hypothetical protein ACTUTK_05785 [Pantoea ananatis]|uniref:hypothetical protein n=1 Tax=Pantoea ananas TaxID=553 RepID=UPI001059BCDD|nr:hypothetical protein [Pantoea ananatis]MCV3298424.1 hypothetical protein [Pantoea ananatis]TDL58871.1 hypothetical protein E2R52_01535 [Pantoea ananatis]